MFTQNELYYACKTYQYRASCERKFLQDYNGELLRSVWRYIRERLYMDREHPLYPRFSLQYIELKDTYIDNTMIKTECSVYELARSLWDRTDNMFDDKGEITDEGLETLDKLIELMEHLNYQLPPQFHVTYACSDGAIYGKSSKSRYVREFDPYVDYYLLNKAKENGVTLPIERQDSDIIINGATVHSADRLFTEEPFDCRVAFTPYEDLCVRAWFFACGCNFYTNDTFKGFSLKGRTDTEKLLYSNWLSVYTYAVCDYMFLDWQAAAKKRHRAEDAPAGNGFRKMFLE